MPQHPKNEFGWLLRDIKLAFRRKDCDDARRIAGKLILRARTPAERETVFRLQNAVRRCVLRAPDLGRASSSKKRKRTLAGSASSSKYNKKRRK